MPRVTYFQIQADDPQRAMDFYTQVFGWEFEQWEDALEYWNVTTGSADELGIDGGLGLRQSDFPSYAFVNTIDVPDVDEYVAKIKIKGGKTLAPKVTLPGVGYYVPCQDTEGNHFGILEADESV